MVSNTSARIASSSAVRFWDEFTADREAAQSVMATIIRRIAPATTKISAPTGIAGSLECRDVRTAAAFTFLDEIAAACDFARRVTWQQEKQLWNTRTHLQRNRSSSSPQKQRK